MAELAKKYRNGLVTVMKKQIDKANNDVSNFKLNATNEDLLATLEADVELLRDTKTAMAQYNSDILQACEEDDDIANEMDIASDLLASLQTEIKKLEAVIRSAKSQPQQPTQTSTDQQLTQISTDQQATRLSANLYPNQIHDQTVKLPKVALPTFDGNPTKWNEYWDTCNNSIHLNNIPNVSKFNYLITSTTGEAKQVISGFSLTSENYGKAISALKDRFGDEEVLKNAHIDALINISESHSDVKSLRSFYDTINSHVRSLETLNVDANNYEAFLLPFLLSKIPNNINLIIARQSTEKITTINQFLQCLNHEIHVRSSTTRLSNLYLDSENQYSKNGNDRVNNAKNKFTNYSSVSALHTQNKFQSKSNFKKYFDCVFCGEKHASAACTNIKLLSDRRKKLATDKRCFKCLKVGHLVQECTNVLKKCTQCNSTSHHQAICPEKCNKSINHCLNVCHSKFSENPKPFTAAAEGKILIEKVQNPTSILYSAGNPPVILPVSTACLKNTTTHKEVNNVNILFDSGSQRSYIHNNIAKLLELPTILNESVNISTFMNTSTETMVLPNVQFNVFTAELDDLVINALVVPKICSKLRQPKIQIHNNNIVPNNIDVDTEIHVLIGCDYMWKFIHGEKILRNYNLVAQNTKLGWIVSGAMNFQLEEENKKHLNENYNFHSMLVCEHEHIDTVPIADWGRNLCEDSRSEEENEKVEFQNDIKLAITDKRYEVCLPWLNQEVTNKLASNYDICLQQLKSLFRRLQKDPYLVQEYNKIFHDQLESGVIEQIPVTDLTKRNQIHYIPHRPVVRIHGTTKIRIVFNASNKGKLGTSLNNCLQCGPCLIPQLIAILISFRLKPIAICADIEKAFLNISICQNDRDYLRFLWVNNLEEQQIIEYRYKRLLFGLKPAPSILGSVIEHFLKAHEAKYKCVNHMIGNFYVDDLVCSVDTFKEGSNIYYEGRQLFKEIDMNLRKWQSNNRKLQSIFDQQYTAEEKQQLDDSVTKILGVPWNNKTDKLQLTWINGVEKDPLSSGKLTKRNILGVIGAIFDPCGFLSPLFITPRIIFQNACEISQNWDEGLPEHIVKRWNSWVHNLKDSNHIEIDRFIGNEQNDDLELHGFCDASEKAYAAVVYIASPTQSRLLISKVRVKPLKHVTIPRLELQGAVLLTQLITYLKKHIVFFRQIKVTLWTDSTNVLHWIKNIWKQFKQYVRHRVNIIRNATSLEEWMHCPGECNPADLPTRGLSIENLRHNTLWWEGPEWLLTRDKWPFQNTVEQYATENLDNTEDKLHTTNYALSNVHVAEMSCITNIITLEDYSCYNKLMQVTAWVLRFINNCKIKNEKKLEKYIIVEEIQASEKLWLKCIQLSAFGKEIRDIKNAKKKNQLVNTLRLLIDDDLIKSEGRFTNICLSRNKPILLPKTSHLTKLIVLKCHKEVLHCGVADTLNQIQEKFKIIQGRQLVKSVLNKCVTCKKLQGRPYHVAKYSPLPDIRLTEGVFKHVGLDFAGPIFYWDSNKGEEKQKCYIIIFTCATVRAVHLEVTESMCTEDVKMALVRFVSRRGTSRMFISDNAKQFKKVASLLNGNIEWRFITEKAPWFGGFWERLIQSIKQMMKKVINKKKCTYTEIMTVLCEIECCMNSRPLTYIEADSTRIVLTPSHFYLGRRLKDCKDSNGDSFNIQPHILFKNQLQIIGTFWTQFYKEYISCLHNQKTYAKTNNRFPKIGEIVLIGENTPRQSWKMGKIIDVKIGRDNIPRSASILIKKNQMLRRPIHLLYPLELQTDP